MVEEFDPSTLAWSIHNTLAFMAAAIEDDGEDGLPVRCTLSQLRDAASKLAIGITEENHRRANHG